MIQDSTWSLSSAAAAAPDLISQQVQKIERFKYDLESRKLPSSALAVVDL